MHRIRRATLQDAVAIARCQTIARATALAGVLRADAPPDPGFEGRRLRWLAILSRPEAAVAATFVADLDGTVVGVAACRPQQDAALAARGFQGELVAVHVLPQHQGRGVGRALVAACGRRFLAHNMLSATLRVPRTSAGAMRFCAALGAAELPEAGDADWARFGWRDMLRLAVG